VILIIKGNFPAELAFFLRTIFIEVGIVFFCKDNQKPKVRYNIGTTF